MTSDVVAPEGHARKQSAALVLCYPHSPPRLSWLTVRGHMVTIWEGAGMSEDGDWVIFGGPQVA